MRVMLILDYDYRPPHAATTGARDPFDDAAPLRLEYRRRRADVRFYRTLADERGRTGARSRLRHRPPAGAAAARRPHRGRASTARRAMLARARARVARLGDRRAGGRCWCAATCARCRSRPGSRSPWWRSTAIQHLYTDDDLVAVLPRRARAALIPGGWFAFDAFAPAPVSSLARERAAPALGAHPFRHPATGERRSSTRRPTGRAAPLLCT